MTEGTSGQPATGGVGNVPLLPENAIVTSDSGSCANWYARDFRVKQGQMRSLSGGLASMGAAVPYAIGAKFAHPDRPVIALVGDGAMQMNNMAELITVAKYWNAGPTSGWIVCVFNNQDLNEVTWEQRVMEGNPRFDATQDIPDFAYSKFGELLGLKGIFVDSPDRLASAWDEALPAIGRWFWKSRPIRRSRRCRRTSRSSKPRLHGIDRKRRRGSRPHHQRDCKAGRRRTFR